jgi:hypothetical protein
MERCKATTRNGNPCRNNVLVGSDYCHIKAHQSMAKQKFYKWGLHFVLKHKKGLSKTFACLGVIYGLLSNQASIASYLNGATKQDVREATQEIQKGLQKIDYRISHNILTTNPSLPAPKNLRLINTYEK